MSTAPLLVELQTEELPPRALQALSAAFAAGLEKGLRTRHFLAPTCRATVYGTPRRMAVHLDAVAARSPDQPFRQKLMPATVALDAQGQPTPALRRKLASIGREALADCWPAADGVHRLSVEADGKVKAVFLDSVATGSTLAEGLQAALDEALAGLPIPKVMNYQLADGVTTVQFIRPAHRLVALHGAELVAVAALGLRAGRSTRGHRFLHAGEVALAHADDYESALAAAHVIARFDARRDAVREQVAAAAATLGATAIAPDELVDEVTALVEWPVVYLSGFEREFLAVPAECLILTMQQNQRYFALRDATGALIDRFALVSNLATEHPGAIVAGNARVIRARLADARFFFDQDRRTPLESRLPGLAHVVYHNRLGSQLERVERLTGLAVAIARRLGVDVNRAERGARLAKADLRTLMVGEFPELQGIMGEHYARHDGEDAEVARALREHYLPRFAGDALPTTPLSCSVALADKLESLVGLFGIGEKPSGDRDPFALRRQALGVLRILMERGLPLPLDGLLADAAAGFAGVAGFADPRTELAAFVHDRLRGLLREGGYSALEVESVVGPQPVRIDLVPRQLEAVRAFAQLPEAASLAAANKRIGNILKKADGGVGGAVDPALLFEPAERELAAAFERLQPDAEALYARGDYTAMLRALAPLKAPVDRFFDDVMVNVDDVPLRANRLALLARLQALMNRVADLAVLSA